MTELPTSLPACATNHPNVASVICSGNFMRLGTPLVRTWCTVCKSLAAKKQRALQKAGLRGSSVEAYGISPLAWIPPERLLGPQSSSVGFGTLLLLRRMREQLGQVAA